MTVATQATTTLYAARREGASTRLTAEELWAIPRVGPPVPAPDGDSFAVVVSTHEREKNQMRGRIWLVPAPAGGPAGEPRPLTAAEHASGEPAFSPDGRRLAFTRKGENGKSQLHVMPLDGGEPQKLTDLPLGVFDPTWLPDGSGIVFASPLIRGHLSVEATRAELVRREKDPVKAHVTEDRVYRFWDAWLTTGEVPHLFRLDLGSGALDDLTPESTYWFDWMEPGGQYDLAPDGKEIAFAGVTFDPVRSLLRSTLCVVSVEGRTVRCLTPDHPAEDLRPRYSPDGRGIVFGMTEDPFFYADRVRLARYDRARGTIAPLLDAWDRSPAAWEFGRDGTLYLEAEDQGRVSLFALKPATPKPEVRELVRAGTVSGTAPARDGRLFFSLHTLMQPPEVHVAPAAGGPPVALTRFTEPVMSRIALGEVREMHFEGAGGETVQMFVVLPPGHQPRAKAPLLQGIHGGPHGISGDCFHFRWNPHVLAAPGYIVAQVNFQGSTSWGQDFAKRIQGAWGDRPFQDVMRATDVLIATGMVDERRMAALGGSYGGYLASWVAGHTDRFACIVNHAGVYDLLAQYASDVTQGRAQSMGGEPWDGLEAIDRWNPARYARGMNTPMLVIHGERDFRVPAAQGLECYGVLKAKGVPARLVYFPDENHWVLKPANSILWYREVLAWLERWLGR
jgi:dipeptidyl aminopeptidase/acylaminoacyl peptidase